MTESAFDLSLFTCTLDRRHRTTVRCTKIDLKNPPEPESAIVKSQINGNVLLIQKYLNIIRSIQPDIPQVDEDGSFGPATHEAVRVFQKLNNLSADGSVGPLTWKKIVAVYNNASERD
jgi:peptidoglycan hydrolase-like protein with peptidoglycan-binding domain